MRALILVVAVGCASPSAPGGGPATRSSAASASSAAGAAAMATIEPRSGSTVSGVAAFAPAPAGGLTAHVQIQGATPGQHGVHVHQNGDCSDPKAASAGPHFNGGAGAHHGGPETAVRHGGDLGNVTVDESGKGTLDVTVAGLSVDGAQDGVIGRSIVVHEKADDLKSDPAGNSGARLACGVIRAR